MVQIKSRSGSEVGDIKEGDGFIIIISLRCSCWVYLHELSIIIYINTWSIVNVFKTSTTPNCSGPIPAQKSLGNSVLGVVFSYTMPKIVGPILDDRLKEKILKPWKGALSIHFGVCLSVCLSVCPYLCTRATDHSFWARNLIFGLSDPWDMRKKRIFGNFYAFYRHFSIFFII